MLKELIDEVENNFNNLPISYFNTYFGNCFLPKLKTINYELNCICNQQSDNMAEDRLRQDIKEFL